MARKKKRFGSDVTEEAEIDISPLIDCVFILLIFFIVTTTFLQEQGFAMDTPQPSANPSESESVTLILYVKVNGRVHLENADGIEIGVAGVQSAVKSHLLENASPVIVQPERETPWGTVLRVWDQARLAGAEELSLGAAK